MSSFYWFYLICGIQTNWFHLQVQELLSNIATLEGSVSQLEQQMVSLHFQLSQERNERRLVEYRVKQSSFQSLYLCSNNGETQVCYLFIFTTPVIPIDRHDNINIWLSTRRKLWWSFDFIIFFWIFTSKFLDFLVFSSRKSTRGGVLPYPSKMLKRLKIHWGHLWDPNCWKPVPPWKSHLVWQLTS